MERIVKIFQGFSSRISNEQNRGHYNEPPRNPPPLKKHFEFGVPENYPWIDRSQYQYFGEKGNQTVRLAPWGQKYTDHAISSTYPSQERYNAKSNTVDPSSSYIDKYREEDKRRSIQPQYVERTIVYGEKKIDDKGRISYSLGDLTVGVSNDGTRYHIKYSHD